MIYLTSDLHGAFDIHKINPDEFIPGRTMTRKDYLIICGDFGCIWDGGSSDRFWLNWLESLPWTTLFIDGNHENFPVINSYPEEEWHGGKVHRIRSNIYHLRRGEIFDIDGYTFLALGGGYSHDAEHRTEGVNWWKEEILSREEAQNARNNLAKHNWKVDFILSHDVFSSHPLSGHYIYEPARYSDEQADHQQFLEEVRQKTDYRAWFCGHYHCDHTSWHDGKPCYVLFDTVEELQTILEKGVKETCA